MNTKNKILTKALELFNAKGVKEVTLRQIALALGISQGNLNYHFKAKKDIVSTLYFQLVKEMDVEMQKVIQEQPMLSFLRESTLVSMHILHKYRFLLKDLYSVLQSDNELKAHYLELQKMRKEQYLVLFQNMSAQGLIRSEELKGEYDRLYERMNILGDNWLNAAGLFQSGNKSVVTYYHALLFEVIYPYLTPKGKDEYKALIISYF
ncbi:MULTISPECIES: TetR/AcrR family transcriptional regulator [Flavobacteriaceae]|uniref:TetR/AcrR family transcriptional regulator n=1 Tax=Flavobacteriaceae TaxID=49546 RepID=UPI0014918ADD|nr:MULTISPECIES: TetR/AcrR family transcriptional regulator [Allomuricauda]MDC6367517.1 TetR/AcrR family transcriptional regulator [Muricauda sp. AC10]